MSKATNISGPKVPTMHYLMLLVLSLAKGDVDERLDRIFEAHKAEEDQFPFFAQISSKLEFNNRTHSLPMRYDCGGSLISAQWIMSTAHCFYPVQDRLEELAKSDQIEVYMGTNLLYNTKSRRATYKNWIKKVVMHPKYYFKVFPNNDIELAYDIAVCLLKDPYQLNQHVQTIVLPEPRPYGRALTKRCRLGTFVDIGNTNYSDSGYNEYVLFFDIVSKTKPKLIRPFQKAVDTVFYSEVGIYIGQAMEGVSGGPFICYLRDEPVVYGVTSTVRLLPKHKVFLGTYEEVEKHMKFIVETVRDVRISKNDRNAVTNKQWVRKPIAVSIGSTIIVTDLIFVVTLLSKFCM